MFDWLFEGRPAIYAALAAAGALFLGLWWRDRRRGWLFGLAGVGLLAGACFLLDRLVETRPEQITRRLQAIARGVKARDADVVMEQFASAFNYHGVNREAFRNKLRGYLARRYIDDLTVWDVRFPDASGGVLFSAKPKGPSIPDNAGFLVKARFVQEGAGQWRMQTFEVYDPLVNQNSPIDVTPYLP